VANQATANGNRTWQDVVDTEKRSDVPEGLWRRCDDCAVMTFNKTVHENCNVCPECGHHYRIDADRRIELACDPGSFEPLWENLAPRDPLGFVDRIPYKQRLAEARKRTGHNDALVCGRAFIKGRGVILAAMDNRFIMASMGSVVGEKVTRCRTGDGNGQTVCDFLCRRRGTHDGIGARPGPDGQDRCSACPL